jgi:hypothetical protein
MVSAGAVCAVVRRDLAFRSTFSIKYFQHAHGLDLATAGAMNSYVFLAAMFATPHSAGYAIERPLCTVAGIRRGAAAISMAVMAYTVEPLDRNGVDGHRYSLSRP